MNILVVNSGSSTVKVKIFDMDAEKALFSGSVEGIGGPRGRLALGGRPAGGGAVSEAVAAADHGEGLRMLAGRMPGAGGKERSLSGIGHRVVHGGDRFRRPLLVDDALLAELRALSPLAPLHNPANLAGITVVSELFPGVPQAVCFDTAFHGTQPPEATAIPLPVEYREAGVRRYGFHGLSFEHLAAVLPGIAGERARGRVVAAHLGSGVSLCAMRGLKSLATTMGFSTLDGPPMATRCGSIDPGALLYLLAEDGMDLATLSATLYRRSGLHALSGISGDMKTLLADPSAAAAAAVRVFVYRVVREIGSLAAALEGLDLLVFTGGIGEHSPAVRSAVCSRLAWLGIEIDEGANGRGERIIDAGGGPVGVCVVPADEEFVIAGHTHRLLTERPGEGDSTVEEVQP